MTTPHQRIRVLAALTTAMLLTGCLSPDYPSSEPTAAPLPPADAATAAPDLLANAGLTLPDEATDIEVDLVDYRDFTEVSITRFTAPRDRAITMCTDAGGLTTEDLSHGGYERAMMGDFSLESGMRGCRIGVEARSTARVLISANDPARVTVLHYRIPSR
ncbi:hypothetical protein [Cellulomonas bogoriensis]